MVIAPDAPVKVQFVVLIDMTESTNTGSRTYEMTVEINKVMFLVALRLPTVPPLGIVFTEALLKCVHVLDLSHTFNVGRGRI